MLSGYPPYATDDSYSTTHDVPIAISAPAGVLYNDMAYGGATAVEDAAPSHGQLTLNSDGSFNYVPNTGFYGSDTFTYHDLSDDGGPSNIATVSIDIMESAPYDQDYSFSTIHDQLIAIGPSGVLQNAFDYDGDDGAHLVASLVSAPAHGTLSDYIDGNGDHPLLGDGSFVYTPATGFYGDDTFTFNVSDGLEMSGPYTVSIDVVENAPFDQDYSFNTIHDQPISSGPAGVLQNAYDYDGYDGSHLTASLANGPAHGTLSDFVDGSGDHPLLIDGSFVYNPAPGFYGDDTFTFNVSDGLEASGPYTVSINVAESPPFDQDYSFSTVHDRPLGVAPSGVLQNAYDYDGNDGTHLAATLVSGPAHGALTDYLDSGGDHPLLVDGSFLYTPADHFVGTDSFTFDVSDGLETSEPYTVSIDVTNNSPFGNSDSYTAIFDTPLIITAPLGVLPNDGDYDGDPLTAVVYAQPAHGSLQLHPDGSFTYTPANDYEGSDSFEYDDNDGVEDGQPVIVALNVVKPTVNIDTDSNNNGAIDHSTDDPVEMRDPGKIVAYNSDDDNANEQQDRLDPGPFVDANGNPVDDLDLQPAVLQVNDAGLDLSGFTVSLVVEQGDVKLWLTRDKQPLQTTYTIGQDRIPATIYAEGYTNGQDVVDWILKNPDGQVIDQDSVKFTVLYVTMVAYRPQTEGPGYGSPFSKTAVPFADEVTPGVGVRSNGDDDNQDGTADQNESSVQNENDLIEVDLQATPSNPAGIDYVLARNNPNIKVWGNATKTGQPLLGDNDTATLSFGAAVWVEWVGPVSTTVRASLSFKAVDANTGTGGLMDTVVFYPFTSVVIVLGGEGQVPSDPAPANNGTFQMAIDEYQNGYDVHMYDEDEVSLIDASGAPYDEIVNAVQNRGVTQVAIIGYSHGGGAVYQLANRLSNNPGNLITKPYTLALTEYIDAITQSTAGAENRRPPGSLFHVSQWETNTSYLQGGPSSADDDLDRTYRGDTHYTIDDDPIVISFDEMRLEQKVSR